MEQESHMQRREETAVNPEVVQAPEAQRIADGIAEALRDGRTIDHETAWLIARNITPGSGALHELAMTGEVTADIGSDLEVAYEVVPELAGTWIAALDGYCYRRQDKGPLDGWPSEPEDLAPAEQPAEVDGHLVPLPALGDIPRPESGELVQSGYDWIEQLPEGWRVEPAWGRDGWDLGSWPLVVVALYENDDAKQYAVATYTEGDVEVRRYGSRTALHAAVDGIAEFHWRMMQSVRPDGLPEGGGLLEKHRGPYQG